jgi:hypothetical protein
MIQSAVRTVTDHAPRIALVSLEFLDNADSAGRQAGYCDQHSARLGLTTGPLQWNSLQPHTNSPEVLLFQIPLRYPTESCRFGVPSLLLLLRVTRAVLTHWGRGI